MQESPCRRVHAGRFVDESGVVRVPHQMKEDASSTLCDMRKLYSLATSHYTSPLDDLSPA